MPDIMCVQVLPLDSGCLIPMLDNADRLQSMLRSLDRVVIAFSGGVDSSVVAAAAQAAHLQRAVAVTANSPSVPAWQLQIARQVAAQIGIEHQVIGTDEVNRPNYRRNDDRRCFYCKETLYQALQMVADSYPGTTIVSGTNADDLGDHRPGIVAGMRSGVVTPLADLGFAKTQIRELARYYRLSNHALPASPCLASRIAYGTEVTAERLARIERAEDHLRRLGFQQCRVRLHEGELARIEVPQNQIGKLVALESDGAITSFFQSIGFQFVSVDLSGFRSGSMNRVLVNIQPAPVSDMDFHRNQEALG